MFGAQTQNLLPQNQNTDPAVLLLCRSKYCTAAHFSILNRFSIVSFLSFFASLARWLRGDVLIINCFVPVVVCLPRLLVARAVLLVKDGLLPMEVNLLQKIN